MQALSVPDRTLAALRFGEAFEALFPADGPMRQRLLSCTTCGRSLDETKPCYVVSDLPIARSYRVVAVYDKPECLPREYAAVRELWDGTNFITVDQRTGAQLPSHPLAIRPLDLAEEAILLLTPAQRGNEELVATLRGFFSASPEDLASEPWLKRMQQTTLVFATGHTVNLDEIVEAHRSHYAGDAAHSIWYGGAMPTISERIRCFVEESAQQPEAA